MRNSRDRWTFFQHPSKPKLSSAEILYWKSLLKKVLKVGMEFEFNLPEHGGSCKGDSKTCPCLYMENSACWQECKNKIMCEKDPMLGRCENRTEKCKSENCSKCKEYKLKCPGINCLNFVSNCFGCEKFEIDCESCPNKFDPLKNPEHIRSAINKELAPSNCYGIVKGYGIHSIKQDGSLEGDSGLEVITVGRRVDYWEFYKMAKKIIDGAIERGAYVNERCSTHMHLLASYYGKTVGKSEGVPGNISELEKDMPETIVANFHQLCRRYQNAITWMTVALDEKDRMTRWEKFRVSVLNISAVINNMRAVREEVKTNSGGKKYGWVNYNQTSFNKDGNIKRFHVELRVADGILSPSAVASIACMYYAIMIKAVEISKYGVLEVGDEEWMKQAKEVKDAILNNMKDYGAGDRFGNTENLHKYYDVLRSESYDLVRQLKHILIRIGPCYETLEKLAEMPIALRRIGGETWEDIERDFEVPVSEFDQFDMKISEFIDLRLIDECKSEDEWVEEVSKALREDEEIEIKDNIEGKVGTYIETKKIEGELIWSERLGSMVTF